MQKTETHRLTIPAPVREWYPTGEGWASRAWTQAGVNELYEGGGFLPANAERVPGVVTPR